MNKVRMISVLMILAVIFSFANVSPAAAQDENPSATPGIIEGTGLQFAVNNSDWLNVTVDSSVPIHLHLSSSPKVILMNIQGIVPDTSSTDLMLGGLEASTTYWRYEDDAHSGVQFTSDANGNYTFAQDLATDHIVRIQAGASTYSIYDDGLSGTGGNCASIGTWDGATRTCTLTQNVNDSIYVSSSGVTLDGAGYTVTLPTWGTIYLYGDSHTLKNMTVLGTPDCSYFPCYPTGFAVQLSAPNSTITDLTITDTYYGVYQYNSGNSIILNNVISGTAYGVYVQSSSAVTISGNTISSPSSSYNYYGVL